MIIRLLLNIMAIITTTLINVVSSILPTTNLGNSLGDIITTILSITQQGINFMYLIFGDTFFLIMGILPGYIVIKYAGIPIIMTIRSFFLNSTE